MTLDNEGDVMLVLSRAVGEKIVISDNIEIVVVNISGDKVRLGIEAPKHISIHRREVYDAVKRSERTEAKQKEITWEDAPDPASGKTTGEWKRPRTDN